MTDITNRRHIHQRDGVAESIKDVILGGQDGLVNVLGVILGVAAATLDVKYTIIAGLAATFAESISMAAVAYTSSKAAKEFYLSELKREEREVEEVPHLEKAEIRIIYKKKGFSGGLLNQIVNKITSNKRLWVNTMMAEELKMSEEDFENPVRSALIVGVSSLLGSFIPLLSFFLGLGIIKAVYLSVILSALVLFVTGAVKAKLTVGKWYRAGIEMALIGILAALIGYGIGRGLGVVI